VSTPSRDRNGGVALFEALVAMAVAALLLLAMAGMGDLVMRNSQAAGTRAAMIERDATGMAALRRDLDRAMRISATAVADGALLFLGRPDRLGFASSGANGQAELVLFAAAWDGEAGRIMRMSAPLSPDASGFDGTTWEPAAELVRGPSRFRFLYAGVAPEGLAWSDRWTRVERMPDAVRVEAVDGGAAALSVTVPIRVNADPACLLPDSQCAATDAARREG
jgi:Tfp pilus assembly protein PilV